MMINSTGIVRTMLQPSVVDACYSSCSSRVLCVTSSYFHLFLKRETKLLH